MFFLNLTQINLTREMSTLALPPPGHFPSPTPTLASTITPLSPTLSRK